MSKAATSDLGRDRGVLSIFTLIATLVVIVILGAIVDFEQQLQARHDANIAAEEAARAGAGCINRDRAYTSGRVLIDRYAAIRAVEDYLRAGGYTGSVTAVGDNSIVVHVTISRPAIFLSLIGITAVRADASAVAGLSVGGVEGRR